LIHTVYCSIAFICGAKIPFPCLHILTAGPRNIFSWRHIRFSHGLLFDYVSGQPELDVLKQRCIVL